MWCPVSLAGRRLERCWVKAREVAKVERREALRRASLGAHAPQAASPGNRDKVVGVQAGRSQGSPYGVSSTTGAIASRVYPTCANNMPDLG